MSERHRQTNPPPPPELRASPILRALEEGQFEHTESRWRQVHLPVLSLVLGLTVGATLWVTLVGNRTAYPWLWAVGAVLVQAVVFAPLMLLSLALAAQWLDLAFGSLLEVSWKVAALTLGVAGVGDALFMYTMVQADYDWSLLVAGFGYYLVLGSPIIALLWGTGIYETALLVFMLYLPRVAGVYLVAVAAPHLFP